MPSAPKIVPTVISLVLAMSMVYILFRIKKMEASVTQLQQHQAVQLSVDDVQRIVKDDLPQGTPDETPDETPEATPEATPKATPEATPEVTPEATPEVTQEIEVISESGAPANVRFSQPAQPPVMINTGTTGPSVVAVN